MTYDAEGVIKRKREDGRRERSEEKEEPRTRRSRGEETTITQEPEEERENTVAGEQSTKGEPVINQELEGEEDTVSKVIETEGETRKWTGPQKVYKYSEWIHGTRRRAAPTAPEKEAPVTDEHLPREEPPEELHNTSEKRNTDLATFRSDAGGPSLRGSF
ncbi:hypothetical protein NDU88_008788 [Pleurodeles waltl]|uniref:Uncharacterized protein n=1 Tax=Pleurodeles waltl TaxID=8319 RepID=A0AAV7PTX4_PLEWA|nr:hypothetical protein NDU88_008788 [Pleurodeles waltl]